MNYAEENTSEGLTCRSGKDIQTVNVVRAKPNIDPSGSPPRWSGSTRRRARGSECQPGQEESSPNLWWSAGMGSCLSSGKVGGSIFVFRVL